ncbi:MAG: ISC system 2Fe-2S type ferredoxin [Aquifex sp.]|nr:MAG: ISC system 2Fe-2S type ferredoxin [Aquifex sp.]
MPKVIVANIGAEFEGIENETIMQILYRNGIEIDSACGGHGQCTSCKVIVVSGIENLYPPEFEEKDTLEEYGLDPQQERLSCQAKLNGKGDVVIYLP